MQEEHTTQQQDPQPYIYVYDSTDRSNRFTREQAARRKAGGINKATFVGESVCPSPSSDA